MRHDLNIDKALQSKTFLIGAWEATPLNVPKGLRIHFSHEDKKFCDFDVFWENYDNLQQDSHELAKKIIKTSQKKKLFRKPVSQFAFAIKIDDWEASASIVRTTMFDDDSIVKIYCLNRKSYQSFVIRPTMSAIQDMCFQGRAKYSLVKEYIKQFIAENMKII